MSCTKEINFILNGQQRTVDVPVDMNTLTMLRDVLKLTGTKLGCGEGECGACTILVDGETLASCLMFAVDCDGRNLMTIEGMKSKDALSDLQKAFVEEGAVQCGFCTPGMLIQGAHIINTDPNASHEQIKRGIEGNLCRCTGYKKIVDAIAVSAARSK